VEVRQSTLPQVCAHGESPARQYGRTATAQDVGWPDALVEVLDDALGQSGARATRRQGLQRRVAAVALGQGGIVMGLDSSRLARNNADCQQVLQLCGLHQPLSCDAEAMYALRPRNERLILGLQGTRSEAELLTMRARLQGGVRPKAARGERATTLPIGFVSAPPGKGIRDPDHDVQATSRLFCHPFRHVGSSIGVVQYCTRQGRKCPTRPSKGPHGGAVWWTALSSGLARRILHHPRSAGALA
jgi:DNA invertase Pin-like site-specific DNA recombinase